MPLIIVGLILVHLMLLHEYISSSSVNVNLFMVEFSSLLNKDILLWCSYIILLCGIICLPQFFMDADNWGEANFLVTPDHIKPEWYFLFAYAILRCIPDKTAGVLGLVGSLVVVVILGFRNLVNVMILVVLSFFILT